jgi:hypothetical protein
LLDHCTLHLIKPRRWRLHRFCSCLNHTYFCVSTPPAFSWLSLELPRTVSTQWYIVWEWRGRCLCCCWRSEGMTLISNHHSARSRKLRNMSVSGFELHRPHSICRSRRPTRHRAGRPVFLSPNSQVPRAGRPALPWLRFRLPLQPPPNGTLVHATPEISPCPVGAPRGQSSKPRDHLPVETSHRTVTGFRQKGSVQRE